MNNFKRYKYSFRDYQTKNKNKMIGNKGICNKCQSLNQKAQKD